MLSCLLFIIFVRQYCIGQCMCVYLHAQMGNLRAPAEPRVSSVTWQRTNDSVLTLGNNQWLADTDSILDTSTHNCSYTHTQRWTLSYHHFPIGLWLTPAWWSAGIVTWYLPASAESMPSQQQTHSQDKPAALLSRDQGRAIPTLLGLNIGEEHYSFKTYYIWHICFLD